MTLFPAPDPARAALYRARGDWRDDTIPDLILAAAARHPDKIAVRDASGAALSYGELVGQSARLAATLADNGVGPGEVVTVCLPNWCGTVTVFLAVLRLGAVINPVPVTYGRADLVHALATCDSRVLVLTDRFRSADFRAILGEIPAEQMRGRAVLMLGDDPAPGTIGWDAALSAAPIPDAQIGADAPAAVLFTSGTESRSKGAVHTHNTILFGERALAAALEAGEGDVAFMASPISHTTGFMHGFVMSLTTGGTLSLLDVFKGTTAARQMAAHGATWTMGATPFLADISEAVRAERIEMPAFRYFLCGGAPIPEALARAATDAGFRVLSIYGATESPPHTMVHPADPVENAWTTDGRPFPGIEVRIVGDDGRDCPVGEPGEEWSRGPNTFLGYLGEPELTARALDGDGWVHSGDLARRLPDGSLRITGRLKEIIVRGGQNISVREVEDYLVAHPAIRRAAVVGIPHPRLGETGCAVVVTEAGASVGLEDLAAYLVSKGVAKFKLPERLEVWPELPMNPSGKIQKFIIRQRLAEQDERTQA
ncbi:MAG: AMP-binding protein [Rhodobacteraceae bacterium]|nr:AMP-binding protein [Paracoccaceae bacterium]